MAKTILWMFANLHKEKRNEKECIECVLFSFVVAVAIVIPLILWIVKLRIFVGGPFHRALFLSAFLFISRSVTSLLSMRTNRTALRSSAVKSDACFCRKRRKKSVSRPFKNSLYYGFWHVSSSYFSFCFLNVYSICVSWWEKQKFTFSFMHIIPFVLFVVDVQY